MAQERPNRMSEWVMLLRKNAPIARDHLRSWMEEVREEPRLLWETPAVRYLSYVLVGLVITWSLVAFVRLMTPPPPPGAQDAAVVADYHVVCSNPECGYNFVITRKFGFDGFPVACPRCNKQSGAAGRRCYSDACGGKWVAPVPGEDGKTQKCPRCGTRFPEP